MMGASKQTSASRRFRERKIASSFQCANLWQRDGGENAIVSIRIVPVQTQIVDIGHRFFEQFNNHLQRPVGVSEDQRLNFDEIEHTFVDGRTVQRQEKSLQHITIDMGQAMDFKIETDQSWRIDFEK